MEEVVRNKICLFNEVYCFFELLDLNVWDPSLSFGSLFSLKLNPTLALNTLGFMNKLYSDDILREEWMRDVHAILEPG